MLIHSSRHASSLSPSAPSRRLLLSLATYASNSARASAPISFITKMLNNFIDASTEAAGDGVGEAISRTVRTCMSSWHERERMQTLMVEPKKHAEANRTMSRRIHHVRSTRVSKGN